MERGLFDSLVWEPAERLWHSLPEQFVRTVEPALPVIGYGVVLAIIALFVFEVMVRNKLYFEYLERNESK